MKAKPSALLLHPVFLISLFLLLLNDLSLKYEFHNGLTGKISDFTGLFVFSFFLFVLFPKYRAALFLFCVIFFSWWKSPFSQSFINAMNSTLPVTIHRVIDYSDLAALIVLPLAWYTVKKKEYATPFYPVWLLRIVCVVSVFAFCNTSTYRRAMYYRPDDRVFISESFSTRKTQEEILDQLENKATTYRLDSIVYYRMNNYGNDFYQYIPGQPDSSLQWQRIPNSGDTALYLRRYESPFYIIDNYILDGDTLHNLEISLHRKKKKTAVTLRSFERRDSTSFLSEENRKKYRTHFKALFK